MRSTNASLPFRRYTRHRAGDDDLDACPIRPRQLAELTQQLQHFGRVEIDHEGSAGFETSPVERDSAVNVLGRPCHEYAALGLAKQGLEIGFEVALCDAGIIKKELQTQ
jgi:hypothetical protein